MQVQLERLIHLVTPVHEDFPTAMTVCGASFTWNTAPTWYQMLDAPIGYRSLADPTCILCVGTYC